jgi:Fe2+ transport system protein FeoA
MARTLADLGPDQEGVIAAVLGDDGLSHRLAELGFTPGVTVRYVRRAPLGDPIQIGIRGFELAVRANEARRVVLA